MKCKYETAMKEKMLITLERDRVVGILASMPIPGDEPAESPEAPRPKSAQKAKAKPTSAKSEAASEPAQLSPSVSSGPDRDQGEVATRKHDTPFPIDRRINPQLDVLGKSNLVNRLTSIRAWVGNQCPGLGLELGIHFQNLVFGICFQYLGFWIFFFMIIRDSRCQIVKINPKS